VLHGFFSGGLDELDEGLFILPDSFHGSADPFELGVQITRVNVSDNGFQFTSIKLGFHGSAPGNGDHLIRLPLLSQVMGNICHHVANSHHAYALAGGIGALTERRQAIIVVDEFFGVIDAIQVFAGQAKPFGALGAGSDQQRLKSQAAQIVKAQVAITLDIDITEIMDPGGMQNSAKLGM
jgi:hypothetical protein